MAIQSTFNIGLQIAKEDTYSVAPNSSTNGFWFQGGRWIPIVTNAMPDLTDRQATIFPAGYAGTRARFNRAPVVGRRWSDGDFGFDVTMDFLPLVAYGVLGSLSSNAVPSENGASMLEVESIPQATSKSLVLVNQPGDGGAILQIVITGTSAGGWVSLSGINADNLGASEVLSFSSAGSLYTRTSFSAIGASSIVVWSNNGASVSINGFQYWTHTVSAHGTSNPSFSVQRHGDPTAGATSKMRLIPGLGITEFELNTPAEARDGLITGSVSFEGAPTATCTATSLVSASPIKIWPAWVLSVTRQGNTYDKVQDLSFTVTGGTRNYRSAAGVQGPQGLFYGANMVEGSMRLLLDSETEFENWKGASSNDIVATWGSLYKLNTNNFQTITASMNALYFEDLSTADSDDVQVLETDFKTISDANTGIIKFSFKNGIPGSAYGG